MIRRLAVVVLGAVAALCVVAPAQAAPEGPCAAYIYTDTAISLCEDFAGVVTDQNCDDVKYRVTLVSNTNDPWQLNDDDDNTGCDLNPLHPKPSPKPSRSATKAPTHAPTHQSKSPAAGAVEARLPVTGPPVGLITAIAGGVVVVGGILIAVTRRRRL